MDRYLLLAYPEYRGCPLGRLTARDGNSLDKEIGMRDVREFFVCARGSQNLYDLLDGSYSCRLACAVRVPAKNGTNPWINEYF
jgi:hypothetical protein